MKNSLEYKILQLKHLYNFSLIRKFYIDLPDKYDLCDAIIKNDQIIYLVKNGELSHNNNIFLLELFLQDVNKGWNDRKKITEWHISNQFVEIPIDMCFCLVKERNSLLHAMVEEKSIKLREISLENFSINDWNKENFSNARTIRLWNENVYVPNLCDHSITVFNLNGDIIEKIILPTDFPEDVIPLDEESLLVYFFRGYDQLVPYQRSWSMGDQLGIYNIRKKNIVMLKGIIPNILKVGLVRLLRV